MLATNQNTGKILMRRIVDDIHPGDYVYYSSPVDNFNISNIPGNNALEWDVDFFNASNGTHGNWISPVGSQMLGGKGYIKRVPSGANFPVQFEGRPRNGVVTTPIVMTPSGSATIDEDKDFNLVGNPYPSSIDAVEFLEDNLNIEGKISIWTHNSALATSPNPSDTPFYNDYVYNYGDQYLTYNALGGTPKAPDGVTFNGKIAAGQGFFVKALSSGEITFTNDMRFDDSENSYNNTSFFRNAEHSEDANGSQDEKQLIWLSLINEADVSTSTLVGYAEGATNNKDRLFDAGSTTGDDFGIYSVIDKENMTIQGRALPFSDTDVVPMAIKIKPKWNLQYCH